MVKTLCIGFVFLLCMSTHAALPELVNEYFDKIEKNFSRIADADALRDTDLKQTDRFFVAQMRNPSDQNQIIYSLMRTNSKGVIISEVIRGQSPERDYRTIANQRWFKYVKRSWKHYYGYQFEETGRYYLFWAKPVILTTRSGKKRFVGAVMTKIDLWDALYKFASEQDDPMLVTLNGKSLFKYRWNKEQSGATETAPIEVPGVKNIKLTYNISDTPPAAQADQAPRVAADAALNDAPALSQQAPAAAEAQSRIAEGMPMKVIIAILALGVILIAIGIYKFASFLRHRRIMKSIDKDGLM